jgi:hypothetical protein
MGSKRAAANASDLAQALHMADSIDGNAKLA